MSNCPIRAHPYGRGDSIPLCNYGNCTHILLLDEKNCPCHENREQRAERKDIYISQALRHNKGMVDEKKIIEVAGELFERMNQ